MRKVMYAGGLFTYDDIKDLPFPENHVQLVEITPPDEVEARKKYLAEAIKSGKRHPFVRFKAVAPKA